MYLTIRNQSLRWQRMECLICRAEIECIKVYTFLCNAFQVNISRIEWYRNNSFLLRLKSHSDGNDSSDHSPHNDRSDRRVRLNLMDQRSPLWLPLAFFSWLLVSERSQCRESASQPTHRLIERTLRCLPPLILRIFFTYCRCFIDSSLGAHRTRVGPILHAMRCFWRLRQWRLCLLFWPLIRWTFHSQIWGHNKVECQRSR